MSQQQGTNAYMVANLLEKMSNQDRDFRYMALNDLMNELQKETFHMEPMIEGKVVKAVLLLMDDKNGEVQNLAVKCLGPLVKQIKENNLLHIIDRLNEYASQQKNDELRGIASVGLKTVVSEVDSSRGNQVCARIIPKLLTTIQNTDASFEMQMDTLDILSEVLARFGGQISLEQQTQIQSVLLPLLSHNRAAIRKRITISIGYLVVHTNDDLFNQLFTFIMDGLNNKANSSEKLRTLVQCAGVLSRYNTARLGKHLAQVIPIITHYTSKADEDDELREICLQTLESFILRCPNEISSFIPDITKLALEYVKYDPNFVEENDDGEDETMEEEQEDEEEDEEDEYDDEVVDYSDDDDDMSWKVRRSASKVLCAIVESRSDLLQQIYDDVAPVLISRFKEREESVRVDILQTFIALLRQTSVYGGARGGTFSGGDLHRRNSVTSYGDQIDLLPASPTANSASNDFAMEATDGPRHLLKSLVPKICRALAKQLSTKSTQTRQVGFHLLRELIVVLHGGLDDYIELFFPAIESSLSSNTAEQQHTSSSNLKIEILYFLRLFFHNHHTENISAMIDRLAPSVIKSVSDRFYKITSEAFLVCIELIKVIRPIHLEKNGQYQITDIVAEHVKYINQIYEVTLNVLNTSDADQEVKERSIMCLGTLLAQVGDILQSHQRQAWDVLLERLRNEVTRLISVKTLNVVSQSPIAAGQELQRCVLVAVEEISLLLRKNNRPLRIASLECLNVLVNRFGQDIPTKSYSTLLHELKPLITDSDLHLLPLALKTVESILSAHPGSVNEVKSFILPSLFQLMESPLLQGSSLESLLSMFAAFAKASPADYQSLLHGLVDPLLSAKVSGGVSAGGVAAVANKQAASTVAQCVAVLAANANDSNRDTTIREFQNYLTTPNVNDSILYLGLMTIGEIGRRIDLSAYDNMDQLVTNMFVSQSEEVKFAAAFALGNICVGNIHRYLPSIVTQIKEQPKRRYLLLHALKEVITRYDGNGNNDNSLSSAADEIWALLLESSETDQEEGTRTVVAECLGKLALTDSHKFLPQLGDHLSAPSAYLRATIATAIKYAVVDPSPEYDDLLKPIMSKFLSLLEDTDLSVRRLALLTINSAVHRKPYLIRNVLDQLIPLLYAETVVKEELIHTVEMGPFKHKVDDGLEIRKAAYECMYTLLSTSLDKIDVYGFLDHIYVGLDDQHDIKMLAYLMLIRLSKVAPTAISQRLDNLIVPFKATLDFKMRTNAVKQEVEKNQELIRAVLRCIVALSPLSDPIVSPRFEQFIASVKTGPFAEEIKLTIIETESRENRSADYMDLTS